MRVLITGSSGQIGTSLALRCLEYGFRVAGLDIRKNSWSSAIPTRVHDLRNAVPRNLAVDGVLPDVVVHLAAHAKVHELVETPSRAHDNITMTTNVLEYCRVHGIPIILSSSREVYGNIDQDAVGESDADFSNVASPYTASKIASEAMVYAYARCYGLPYLVFRLSNVYGRYDHDLGRMERVVPLFLRAIRNDEPVTVYGAEKVLDFTYIDDCIDGIFSGIECFSDRRVVNATLNLAYGRGQTLTDLTRYLGECLGKRPTVNIQPCRVGEIAFYVANLSRAKELLGFCPTVSLREGIERVVSSRGFNSNVAREMTAM